MNIYEGNLIPKDVRIGIVVARFNEFITSKLLGGAVDTLKRHDISEDSIDVAWVPGAFEIPLIAKKMASMTLLSVLVQLSEAVHHTMTLYATRLQRELLTYHSTAIFL